jgi:hypothetical protein
MSWRERKKERGEKNAISSGHLRLCQQPRAAHALRSDQNYRVYISYTAYIYVCCVNEDMHHIYNCELLNQEKKEKSPYDKNFNGNLKRQIEICKIFKLAESCPQQQ